MRQLSTARIAFRPSGPVPPPGPQAIGLFSVGVGGLLLAGAYRLSDGRVGVPCLLYQTTGVSCPFCGTTRMAAALLHGDLAAAWAFNGPMLLIAPVVGVAVGYQILAWVLERSGLLRLPRIRIRSRAQNLLGYGFLVLMATFGVARNLL